MTSDQRKRYIIWEPFLLAAMVVLGMILGNKMDFYYEKKKDPVSPEVRSIGEVEQLLRFIETNYVDDVDGRDLTQKAIDAILQELDPHSQYLSPRLREELEEDMNGAYLGVGVEKIRIGDSLYVIWTTPGSPADGAGIVPGDRIVAVNDSIEITSDISDDSLAVLMKREQNADIALTLVKSSGDTAYVNVPREEIPLPSIDIAVMLDDSIGYIKVNRFSNDVYKEFMQNVEDLANEGMDDIVIDLRGNPGGYLQEAVKILSQLIEQKESVLVYTEGAHSKRTEYKSTGRRFYEIDDITLLTDTGSASASEIMAGALQDLDRGLVVGRRTFGKGLVQEQYRLLNGAALRLTTARYFTPSGRLIQRDYTDIEEYERDAVNRHKTGENRDERLIPIGDSTRHFTRTGRIVYGGGGIVPDVFVPKANPFNSTDWPHILFFLQAYLVRDLDRWDLPDNQERYMEDFVFSEEELDQLIDHLEHQWPISELSGYAGRETIGLYARAYLARMKYRSNDIFFRILMKEDDVLKEARTLIEENKVDPLLARIQASNPE